jgi:catalase
MVGHLRNIEESLAERVANGLAMSPMPPAPAAAMPVKDLPPSPAVQLIGKAKDTLEGRVIGILINEGSDAALIATLKKAVLAAGANVKLVAPKVGQVKLSDGSALAADGQLAGTPSIMFDAVAIVLSKDGATALTKESAAVDFVRDAFGHLKAIAADAGAKILLDKAGVVPDNGVMAATDTKAFLAAAKTRQWKRESSVRTLA